MSATDFHVQPFSPQGFCAALGERFAHGDLTRVSPQARYLYGYLEHLEAKTILAECDYTDGDFLDDYASYYAKSFDNIPRHCRRLHFFGETFTEADFRRTLLGADATGPGDEPARTVALQESYLGFVVIRPLPETIIGRTVLRTYEDDGKRRHYHARKEYTAHLFGIPLRVTSLAYQEQDSVVAACATVALWSAFQQASALFGIRAPTPAEVTRAATRSLTASRPLPSRGLVVEQMAAAIREAGLEPEFIECGQLTPILSVVHGYLQLGLPVIMALDIEGHGGHAITITGYSLRDTRQVDFEDVVVPGKVVPRIGLRIDELYAHDDGVGPFARMHVRHRQDPKENQSAIYFEGQWTLPDKTPSRLEPIAIIAPVYHKVRLVAQDLQRWVFILHRTTEILAPRAGLDGALEWQLDLMFGTVLKEEWRASALSVDDRQRLLLERIPRFVWRARVTLDHVPLWDVIFDATGIARSFPGVTVVYHNDAFRAAMKAVLGLPGVALMLTAPLLELLEKNT